MTKIFNVNDEDLLVKKILTEVIGKIEPNTVHLSPTLHWREGGVSDITTIDKDGTEHVRYTKGNVKND